MKDYSIAGLILLCMCCNSEHETFSSDVSSFNDDWIVNIDGRKMGTSIPHTPKIEPLIVNDQWQGLATYTKNLTVDNPKEGKTWLHFEGVMHESSVRVNGTLIKNHVGGYLPFSVDLTNHLLEGRNEIRVEVFNTDNPTIPPGKPLEGLDFNFYGGIYRDVWLIKKGDIFITDPFIHNDAAAGWTIHFDKVSGEIAEGSLSVDISNGKEDVSNVEVKAFLSSGSKIESFSKIEDLSAGTRKVFQIPLEIPSPALWSTTSPNLYDLRVEVFSDGILVDEFDNRVGIRNIRHNEDGFFLNGEKLFLRGTNRHQEYPYVGYAISNNANFRDALKIKNAGFDFVRLSHYPHDEAFLDACDELGLLVMNAIPGWQHYQEGEFVENSYQDIRNMVRRDRNHPSMAFWEVSLNESDMTEDYMETANEILREELPFKDTYSAGWIDHPSYDLYIPARQHGKPPHYWNHHKDGKRSVFIAEYGDWEYYAHNAGFNQTAFADLSDEERNSRQLRANGERRLLQQAMNFQEAANSNRKGAQNGTIGHSNWLMFDYNRGYADDLEASGIADVFRIPKFAYHFYRSQRPPGEDVEHPLVDDGPMVKIASYWTEESPTDIRIFSNCEEISLFLNGELIGTSRPHVDEFSNHLDFPPFKFKVPKYEAGELKALGFINGKQVASEVVLTPGDPVGVMLRVDTVGSFGAEKDDLFFVYAEVVDENGTVIPTASDEIPFKVEGSGKLIGKNPMQAEAGIASILFKGDIKNSEIVISSASSLSNN